MAMKKTTPNPVDIHVGAKLRERRTLLGLSQEKLADRIGLTFQQVQKYERGANRIGASRLFELSEILCIPVSYFFDNYESKGGKKTAGFAEGEQAAFESQDPMKKKETIELVRAYYKISSPKQRKQLLELAKSMGNSKS